MNTTLAEKMPFDMPTKRTTNHFHARSINILYL